jgi:hypothetical protein
LRVALVDHSYHVRTASTAFFAQAVLADCEVDEFWDDSWQGGAPVDVRQIAEGGYDLVVVFQVETAAAALAAIGEPDVVFIPMWDSCLGLPDEYWLQLRNVRVVSFAHALHGRVRRLGVWSEKFTYFPDPEPLVDVTDFDSLRGFLWLRRREVRWEHIRQLTAGTRFTNFHVHLAQDPGNEQAVSLETAAEYELATSTWFETRAQYIDVVAGCNVYFAPRVAEGIGSSFLEAMAMGMCVVAVDAPTMNEYLTHGATGLLWSVEDPRPLDFSHAPEIGKRARERAFAGRERWLGDLDRLREFMWTPRPAQSRGSRNERSVRPRGAARRSLAVNEPPPPGREAQNQGGRRCEGIVMRDRGSLPLVTVVTATLNCAEDLDKTMLSTVAQDYPNLELIVVDGGSTDGTLEVIRAHEAEIDLWTSQPDRGPYDAMNRAADLANGRYCLFMNAGDWFVDSSAISRALAAAPRTADFIIGHHVYVLLDGTETLHKANDFEETWHWLRQGELSDRWLQGVPGHQSTFTRTQLLREHRYDIRYHIAADHEFMYRQRLDGASFFHSDETIAMYASGGYSWNNRIRCLREWLDIARRYGPPEAAERYFRPLIRSAVRDGRQGPEPSASGGNTAKPARGLITGTTRRLRRVARAVTRSPAMRRRIREYGAGIANLVEMRRPERRRLVGLVKDSGLFAESWYCSVYPDLSAARIDPIAHYLRDGADELRNPSPFFDTAFYLEANHDVSVSGRNPLIHYLEHGAAEGRTPTSWFSDSIAALEPECTNGTTVGTLMDWLATASLEDLVRAWPGPSQALPTETPPEDD